MMRVINREHTRDIAAFRKFLTDQRIPHAQYVKQQ